MLNGALAGCVAECAGCNVYQPWAGFVVSIVSTYYICTLVFHFFARSRKKEESHTYTQNYF